VRGVVTCHYFDFLAYCEFLKYKLTELPKLLLKFKQTRIIRIFAGKRRGLGENVIRV